MRLEVIEETMIVPVESPLLVFLEVVVGSKGKDMSVLFAEVVAGVVKRKQIEVAAVRGAELGAVQVAELEAGLVVELEAARGAGFKPVEVPGAVGEIAAGATQSRRPTSWSPKWSAPK